MNQNIQKKMSSYLRTIPNKFTFFVNTRRQVTNIDYQLLKHIKSSLFLEEFLGRQTAVNLVVNYKAKHLNSETLSLNQNVPVAFVDSTTKRQKNVQILNVIVTDVTNANLSGKNTLWGKSVSNSEYKDSDFLKMGEIPSAKMILDNVSPNHEKDSIFYSKISSNVQNVTEMQPSEVDNYRKPSDQHLHDVFDVLQKDLPLLFTNTMNYRIYTNDLIFVNNFKGTTTIGVKPYVKQIMLLKVVGHLKFAYVKFNILKMTMHPEDNSIKVRWRIVGVSTANVFIKLWKHKMWRTKDHISNNNNTVWYDGFSIFFVNNDGKIFKHVVDKMMPDQSVEQVKTPIEAKLALFTALLDLNLLY